MAAKSVKNKFVTGKVRFSFVHVFEPAETLNGQMKYSVSILIPKTDKERKKEGMEKYKDTPGPKTYLCDFCPVAIGVAQRKRKLMGME